MARPPKIPSYPDDILSLPMFHSDICSSTEAENYVTQHGKKVGSYLIRPNSENDPTYVSITVSVPGNNTCNVKVYFEKRPGVSAYYILHQQKFPSMNELLNFYREHRIHCKEDIDVRLLNPLRKLNQPVQKESPVNSHREDRKSSVTSTNSEKIRKGIFRQKSNEKPEVVPGQTKARSQSESQSSRHFSPPSKDLQHTGSLKNHTATHSGGHAFPSRSHSLSESEFQNPPSTKKNANTSINKGIPKVFPPKSVVFSPTKMLSPLTADPKSVMLCRPPAPLPRPDCSQTDDSFYYSSIDVNKNFFPETYMLLKESEKCECGLRVCDSELGSGWTIHRSQDPATFNHIFFQQGETTSWDLPKEQVNKLTQKQVEFILCLCCGGNQPIPVGVRNRLDKELNRKSCERGRKL